MLNARSKPIALCRRTLLPAFACAAVLLMLGCTDFGKVQQGRVVAYDHQNGIVTLIPSSALGSEKASPIAVKIPQDPKEMGPAPEAGKRLLFDTQNKKLVVFDAAAGAIKTFGYTPVVELTNVASDDKQVKGVKFPVIDREKKTITLYSSRDKKLITFTVADEYFSLPEDTWKAGDDIRYYFKQPGQALRMMNVTKTNVMKG
jgi:hypothetical protein